MNISRRETLRRLTVLVGGALSAPAAAAVLAGLRAESPPPGWQPRALTGQQADLLDILVDLIIPPTDTPGAKDAGVPGFIDKLLERWVEPDERTRFYAGMAQVDRWMERAHGVPFAKATREQQIGLLTRLDQEAIAARRAGQRPLPFFATLKEWTLVGYYTSEVGASQELHWLAQPGYYDGDKPLADVGRTWA